MVPNLLSTSRQAPRLLVTLAAVCLLATSTPAASAHARAASAQPTVGVSEAYACRSDVYPFIEGATPAGSHVAGVVEAGNGDLLYTFNAHWMEGPTAVTRWGEGPVTRVFLSRLRPGSQTWSEPERIDYPRPLQVHNAVLWDDGAGTLFQFFTVIEGEDHNDSTLEVMTSTDHGYTWSQPRTMRQEWGWMFGTRPLRMSNGEVLLPVYKEGFPNGVGFLVSSDGFQTWEVHPESEELWPPFVIMASAVELDQPGHLLAFLRGNLGRVYQARSVDYGRTWTPAVPTDIPSPWARVALLKLDNGNLVVAHNASTSDRTPLRIALSEDGGLSWPHEVLVETDPDNRFDYPYLDQSSDGFIHLGYTHNNKRNMRHVVFTEEFVRDGVDIPTDTSFGRTEYRDGELSAVGACSYTPLDGDGGGAPLFAQLSGDQEVPGPGDPDGSGSAVLRLNQGQARVCYELTVTDIADPTAAHIHAAPAGQAGPIVVPLPITSEGLSGCTSAEPDTISAIRQNPENYYVNVHNDEYPDGAVRGQLERPGRADRG